MRLGEAWEELEEVVSDVILIKTVKKIKLKKKKGRNCINDSIHI